MSSVNAVQHYTKIRCRLPYVQLIAEEFGFLTHNKSTVSPNSEREWDSEEESDAAEEAEADSEEWVNEEDPGTEG